MNPRLSARENLVARVAPVIPRLRARENVRARGTWVILGFNARENVRARGTWVILGFNARENVRARGTSAIPRWQVPMYSSEVHACVAAYWLVERLMQMQLLKGGQKTEAHGNLSPDDLVLTKSPGDVRHVTSWQSRHILVLRQGL
eukprot:1160312-Pelagomonas_calceolata.AAC.3